MKKILFPLVALVCSMSINAQVMKVMKGDVVVATYTADQADNVVFEKVQGPIDGTTGTATRTGNVEVPWVQLWKNGPKFAAYNVGAENDKAEDYGGYYRWGSNSGWTEYTYTEAEYNRGTDDLTDDNDTATNLWGSNWRMPTQTELENLLTNCDVVWTDNYNGSGVKGSIFTGKDDYATNSLFLPAAGAYVGSRLSEEGDKGNYWSSTPRNLGEEFSLVAWRLCFDERSKAVGSDGRENFYPVRAVLAEQP